MHRADYLSCYNPIMNRKAKEAERRVPIDPNINPWFQLPDSDALVEAVGNLKGKDIRQNPNLKSLVRRKIEVYEEGGRISTEIAVQLEEHLVSISQTKKRTS